MCEKEAHKHRKGMVTLHLLLNSPHMHPISIYTRTSRDLQQALISNSDSNEEDKEDEETDGSRCKKKSEENKEGKGKGPT